jgi:hypothetical protein
MERRASGIKDATGSNFLTHASNPIYTRLGLFTWPLQDLLKLSIHTIP